jgi:hypothetical protein
MADDAKAEKISVDKKYLAKLEREVKELREVGGRSGSRVSLLEERMKQEALANVRRRMLEDAVAQRGMPLDVSKAAGLLERLTSGVAAEVDETGKVFVSEEEYQKIREQVDAIIGSLAMPPKVVPPPIAPGEPPTRPAQPAGPGFANCWEAQARRGGAARGRELIEKAAKELERNGVL